MQERQLLTVSLFSLAVISGVFGLFMTGVFDTESLGIEDISKTSMATGVLMGHAVIEAHDSEGNLIAHRETDNEVVNGGENCVLKMLFGGGGPTATGNNVCVGQTTAPWTIIAIGTNSTTAYETQTQLKAEENGTLARGMASTQTWTNGTGDGTAAKIQLSKTFTSDSTTTIVESGLFNSTTISGSGMLARQTFSGVALSNGDSITVTWTFTVGD